jgi:hypothetical protein
MRRLRKRLRKWLRRRLRARLTMRTFRIGGYMFGASICRRDGHDEWERKAERVVVPTAL